MHSLRASRKKGREFIAPTRTRLSVDALSYQALRQKVLRRDGWRCQFCGAISNLEVHHKVFRSHQGENRDDNLITLCNTCHSGIHRSRATERSG
jgi:5-methylcytosine-specific restriction endonuclease McrA